MKLQCTGPRICEFKKNPRLVPRSLNNKYHERDFRKSSSLRGKYCCYHHWVMETTYRAYIPYIPPRTASQPSDIQVSDDAPLLNHDTLVKALSTEMEIDSSSSEKKKKKKSTEMAADSCSSSKAATVLDLSSAKKKKKKSTEMVADASVLDLSSAHSESHHHQLVKCSTFTDGAAVDSVKAAMLKRRPKHGSSQFRKKKKQNLN